MKNNGTHYCDTNMEYSAGVADNLVTLYYSLWKTFQIIFIVIHDLNFKKIVNQRKIN